MANTIAILVFDGAEEMDFVGPWEVFTAAVDRLTGERVMTVAETLRPVVCEKGMRVLPDATYEDARGVDVVVVPGGSGARREIENPATVRWLTETVARRQVDQVDPSSYCLMHGRDAFVECGFTPHHADAATTERQRRDRPTLTKAVLLHDCHLPRRFGIAIPSKPPRSMSFAGDAILSARLLSSTTADFGPEVVINLPPSPAARGPTCR